MSNRELAKNMIDQIPDDKLVFIINILENLGELSGLDIHAPSTPNQETLHAMEEVNEMIQTGTGEHFTGPTADFLRLLAED